ncbi:MAG: hypothetical protein KC620_02230 [Myxococcales bacterium]|nr:hypothetical protein [Myxococcales bacterium]
MKQRVRLMLVSALALAGGCDNLDTSDEGKITKASVEGITAGTGEGVVFTGTWVLEYKVTESNCGVITLPDSFPESPPALGEEGTEEEPLVQSNGELTRGIDDIGDNYLFAGGVDKDGTFEYGKYFTLAGVERIEVVTGKMAIDENLGATLTGTSKRRYKAAIFDCTATLRLTGTRTATGGS